MQKSSYQVYTIYRYRPAERVRVAGLFCFLGGICSLALAIGVGRASEGPKAGLMERYMIFSTPLLCLFFLQFTLYSSNAIKIHLQRTLALLMFGLLIVNTCKGLAYANNDHQILAQLEADIRAGIPPAGLAVRHCEDLGFAPVDVFQRRLEVLRQAQLRPYDNYIKQDDKSLAVQRFSNVSASRDATQRVCLLPGQSLTQRFQVPRDAMPYRIDVQISSCRGRRTMEHVVWDLYAVGPNNARQLLAHDTIDMNCVGRDDYVTLTIPPSSFAAITTQPLGKGTAAKADCIDNHSQMVSLALVFSSSSECLADLGVELPLYSCVDKSEKAFDTDALPQPSDTALSMKGYLFLKRSSPPVASMASKPSLKR